MRPEAPASPLTVWVGQRHYTFPPGRDVTVGRDSRSDLRLDGEPTHLVLHHDGRQWVAIDRSQNGIYVDGVRMSTVSIRDGRAITLGDPRNGLRLVFQLGGPATAPPGQRNLPPPGVRPAPPPPPRFDTPLRPRPPSQQPTRPLRSPPPPAAPRTRPPAPAPPSQLPTQRFPPPQPPRPPVPPPTPPAAAAQPELPRPQPESAEPAPVAQRKGHQLVERMTGAMTGAMQRLIPHRAQPRPHEEAPTGRLPRGEVSAEHPPQPRRGSLAAHRLGLNVDGQPLLSDVSFSAQPGTLTAIIGPSQAARSGLVNIVGGVLLPNSGNVTVDGHDPYAEEIGRHIGMVPQDDLLHLQLTVEQALGYLAELRLPSSTSADERRRVVDQAIAELELTSVRTIQVGKLSDEDRKRASVASELITGPALLVLDEPTAGLGPAQQRHTMATLRRLADAGRVVVVSTSSVEHLHACDQVLMLTATGMPAFIGPPGEIEATLHTSSWPEIFAQLTSDPDRAHATFLGRHQQAPPEQAPAAPVEAQERPARLGLWRQLAVTARRQAWLIIGDQRYFVFLTLLPLLFGGLVLAVPGHAGFAQADPYGNSPDEALEILVVLNMGAVIMGTALTIRDILAERPLLRREQTDVSTGAYLTAKIGVYSLVAVVQTAVITTVAVAGKGAPSRGAVLLGSPALELYLAVVFTAIVSAVVALVLSSLAEYIEQLLLMAVVVVLISVLFSGGVFPLAGRFGVEQIAWLLPSRWGFAASASSVDLPGINVLTTHDVSWTHSAGWWVFDMALLIGLGVVCTAFLWWRLRRIGQPAAAVTDGEQLASYHQRNEFADDVGHRDGGRAEQQLP